MKVILAILVVFKLMAADAQTVKTSQLIGDADVSFSIGDYYRAYRSYEYLISSKSKFFYEKGLLNYLQTLQIISTQKGFI